MPTCCGAKTSGPTTCNTDEVDIGYWILGIAYCGFRLNYPIRNPKSCAVARLLCVGHTHWPMDLTVNGVHLLNVGSVSNVFPPDLRASYVMLEADEAGYHVQHRRVPYDREAVVRELRRAPLGAGRVNHPAAKYIIQYMRGENHPHWRRTRQ